MLASLSAEVVQSPADQRDRGSIRASVTRRRIDPAGATRKAPSEGAIETSYILRPRSRRLSLRRLHADHGRFCRGVGMRRQSCVLNVPTDYSPGEGK